MAFFIRLATASKSSLSNLMFTSISPVVKQKGQIGSLQANKRAPCKSTSKSNTRIVLTADTSIASQQGYTNATKVDIGCHDRRIKTEAVYAVQNMRIKSVHVLLSTWILGVLIWGRDLVIPFFLWPSGRSGQTCADVFSDAASILTCQRRVGVVGDYGIWSSHNADKALTFLFTTVVCPLIIFWLVKKLSKRAAINFQSNNDRSSSYRMSELYKKNIWIVPIPLTVAGVFFLASGLQTSRVNWLGQHCERYSQSACLHPELVAIGAGFLLAAFLVFKSQESN